MSFDYDQLNFFLNDRARSAEIIRTDYPGREREGKGAAERATEKTEERKNNKEEISRGFNAQNMRTLKNLTEKKPLTHPVNPL